MKYLIGHLDDQIIFETPNVFLKNKYSKIEYNLVKSGLKKFYNIESFNITYDEGKPILDVPIFISISNSYNTVIVAFSLKPIGVDIELIRDVDVALVKYLNMSTDSLNVDVLKEYCSREAIIKLDNLKLFDINRINKDDYIITYILHENNVIALAQNK